MSIAYKCDRCGKLYECYDEKVMQYASKPMIFTCSTNIHSHDHPADLCKDCYESFMEWWNKPTPTVVNEKIIPLSKEKENEVRS